MIVMEIVGWVILGVVVGYYSFDFSRIDRYSKPEYAVFGAVGSLAGGLLGYLLTHRPMLGQWTFNVEAAALALVGAIGAVVVANLLRRHGRPAHHAR